MDTFNVVASRLLEQSGQTYHLLVEKPEQDDTGDFACSWHLVDESGLAIVSQKTYGVDSIQALLLTFLVLGERLEAESSEFTHLGRKGTGLLRHMDSTVPGVTMWYLPTFDPTESHT
ncbi:MAG: hypothetical protein FWD75_00325 [Propionibacteriaceae bacterium]|nr:hypothetical protein [Propionibacteriaceae bacterium]